MASADGMRSRKSNVAQAYPLVYDDSTAGSDAGLGDDYGLKEVVKRQWTRLKAGHDTRVATYSPIDWAALFLPCVGWLRTYNVKQNLWIDVVAGLSTGFMVVPQGMSYALLANLPPVFGLYGALTQVFIYAALGSSRHLAVGPVAVTSLLMGHSLRTVYPEAANIEDASDVPPEYLGLQEKVNQAAIQISFLVALIWLAAGILRLGFLARFLSHSVISGFTTGAACIIGLSQLKYAFGIKIPQSDTAIDILIELGKAIDGFQWREFLMFVVWFALLLAIKVTAKRVPRLRWIRPLGPLTVLIIGIVTVVIGDLDGKELIKTVSSVPKGLPPVTISKWFPMTDISKQFRAAAILFIVDFMESISIAKALARKHKYTVNTTQELLALGTCNLAGSAFSASTATGSFSRSSVTGDIGAKTPLHGVVTGLVVMMTLLFITPVLERTPYNATGAIILSAVVGLFDYTEGRFLWKTNRLDFLVWAAAFITVFFAGVEIGLGVAVGLAVLIVVLQSAFPHTAVLGRLPDTDSVYRNVKQYPRALEQPHVVVVRIDAPIYFANVETVRERLEKYVRRANSKPELGRVKFLVADFSPVSFVDSTGMHALLETAKQFKEDGVRLVLANPSKKVQASLRRAAVLDVIGAEWVFVRTADAVAACVAESKLASGKQLLSGDDTSTTLPSPPDV